MKIDIETIKRKLLVKYPFFGSVVANVIYRESNNIPTAATDGKIIYYNPKFLESLLLEEQVFIFAHEVCHIAFNHIKRSAYKNSEIWNIATDAVINQFLKKDGLKIVGDGVDMEDAINYDVDEYYKKLLIENDIHIIGHDSHDLWEEALQNKSNDNELEQFQDNILQNSEKEAFKSNREEKKKNLEELKKEICEKASKSGNSISENILKINNIGKSKPILDWRYILREAIQYNVDWSYKNSYLENGVLSAKLEEQPSSETEIVLDTSGSINEELLKNFLRECKNILKHSKLKVGCFDTTFHGFKKIETEDDIENMEFIGGGGTDFNVAVNAFSKRVENKIIFTDGESEMPSNSFNVIWIVFGDEYINPKGGRVINITGEQMNELFSAKRR